MLEVTEPAAKYLALTSIGLGLSSVACSNASAPPTTASNVAEHRAENQQSARVQHGKPMPTIADREAEAELARLGESPNGAPTPCRFSTGDVNAASNRCESGARDACIRAGGAYWRGCGVPRARTRAEDLFERGCQLGSHTSCDMQAILILEAQDGRTEQAAQLLERTCAAGLHRACANLGVVLVAGLPHPTRAQVHRGIGLVRDGCTLNLHPFCTSLAQLVADRGLKQHFDATLDVLRTACSSGNLDSCYAWAIALEDGTLGVRNYTTAAHVGAYSCERRHLPSCNATGYMLALGHGFKKAPELAARLFHYACDKGYAPACDSMGEATEKGWGGPADPQKALEFYLYACQIGSEHACRRAAELGK